MEADHVSHTVRLVSFGDVTIRQEKKPTPWPFSICIHCNMNLSPFPPLPAPDGLFISPFV